MKIIIDSNNNQDIEVEEFLEPNFTSYQIKCGDNSIMLNDYQMKELIRSLMFISNKYKLYDGEEY